MWMSVDDKASRDGNRRAPPRVTPGVRAVHVVDRGASNP
jgi:hypothetical protein